MTKNVTFLSPTILYPNFIFRNIESFNEAEAEAKAGESELTQDGDEPLLAELKQQDFQPEKFGSGHAETNNGNDSIILFESAVEKPIAVILPNTTIIKENSEETIETDQGVYTYDCRPKTFWKIETANAIFWMYLGGTAKKIFF